MRHALFILFLACCHSDGHHDAPEESASQPVEAAPDFRIAGEHRHKQFLGLRVYAIRQESKFARIGFSNDDIIIAIDNQPVTDMQNGMRLFGAVQPGTPIEVLRGDDHIALQWQ